MDFPGYHSSTSLVTTSMRKFRIRSPFVDEPFSVEIRSDLDLDDVVRVVWYDPFWNPAELGQFAKFDVTPVAQ